MGSPIINMRLYYWSQDAVGWTFPPPAPPHPPSCPTSPQHVAGVLTCISHKEAPVQQLPLESHNTPLLRGFGLSRLVLRLPHPPLHHHHCYSTTKRAVTLQPPCTLAPAPWEPLQSEGPLHPGTSCPLGPLHARPPCTIPTITAANKGSTPRG